VEILEDRLAPAAVTVNTAGDNNDISINPFFGIIGPAFTDPDGQLSLREAIELTNFNYAFAGQVFNAINFGIGAAGSGHTITLAAALGALPAITQPVTINGWTQGAGGALNTPLIAIDGTNVPNSFGLNIQASNSTIIGLKIDNFANTGGGNATGIGIFGGTTNVSLFGNFLLNNGQFGVWLGSGANGNLVGSNLDGITDAQDRNVISGNMSAGIFVDSNSNNIRGNLIGLDANGNADPNGDGIIVGGNATGNTIGTNNPSGNGGANQTFGRNVISGNTFEGIFIAGSSNFVEDNFIGTNTAGTAAIANGFGGVYIQGSSNRVGTTTSGTGNVISGNANGVVLDGIAGGGKNNLVQNNFIGTNATGTGPVGNTQNGVLIYQNAQNNLIGGIGIGGNQFGFTNVISGNGADGVLISNAGSTGNVLESNFIGTNAAGTAAIGNSNGVEIWAGASNNFVGGGLLSSGNVVSGNAAAGVSINDVGQGGATGNVIQQNWIGVEEDGKTPLPNTGPGVIITNVSGNRVGGPGINSPNIISGNTGPGVAIVGTATRDQITQNSIFLNGLGIDLGNNGVTLNDSLGHVGPNNYQNFPVITYALSNGTNTTVSGTLSSTPNTTFTLEFFDNTTQNASGFGEGQTFLGNTTVTTDASGNASFVVSTLNNAAPGDFLSATATDPFGNTSEFSQDETITGVATKFVFSGPPNPSAVGTAEPFMVTAEDAQGRTVKGYTGTVTFTSTDGTAVLPPNSTLTLGVGSFTVTFNTEGVQTITATDTANSALKGSATVNVQSPTVTTLTSTLNPSFLGDSVTFNAVVIASSGSPIGTVTFSDNGVGLATVGLVGGTASFTTSSLTVGTHPMTATFNPLTNKFVSSTSSPALNQVVQDDTTTTLAQASPNPSSYGQTVTLSATVIAANGATPTGTVGFFDSTTNTSLGSAILAGGFGSITVSNLAVNSAGHTINVSYTPVGNFKSSSTQLVQTVNAAATTTSLSSSNTAPNYGDAVQFTATVSVTPPGVGPATGNVQFFIDGSLAPNGTVALTSSGTATYTTSTIPLGNHNVTATYLPDTNSLGFQNFLGSSAAAVLETVTKATPTVSLVASPNPAPPGNLVTISATVTPGSANANSPSGSVTFFDGANALATINIPSGGTGPVTVQTTTSSLTLGNHSLTATYNGDPNYNTATSPAVTETIQNAQTTTTLTATPPGPIPLGQSTTLNAQVVYSGPAGQQPATPLTGTVTFKEGATTLGTVNLSASGQATLQVSNLTGGTHSYTAQYSGDSFYSPSNGSVVVTVQQAATMITLISSASPAVIGQPVTFTATVQPAGGVSGTPTGTVTFFDNGVQIGTATLSNGAASFTTSSLAKGSHSITATYGGDSSFLSSTTQSPLSELIGLVPFIFTR
jgi:hypothetical protein